MDDFGFEGPEKTLEIDFKPGVGHPNGLREITREKWDTILEAAKCLIMSKVSITKLDAYVLSESSLFVYSHQCTIKTCGTTTLLRCYPLIFEEAAALGLEVEWVSYSRKNFTNPDAQIFPHASFSQEVSFMDTIFKGSGSAYILGPITSDHWYVYAADYICRAPTNDRTLDLMMFDMDPAAAAVFFKEQAESLTTEYETLCAKETEAGTDKNRMLGNLITEHTGISKLLPGAKLDAQMFEPCGYSMNGILLDSYFTIHVTPEPHCSYVSFATNTKLPSYDVLIRNVLQIFRPKRFVMTLFADELALKDIKEHPFSSNTYDVPAYGCYKQRNKSQTQFEGDWICEMGNYSLTDGKTPKASASPPKSIRKWSE